MSKNRMENNSDSYAQIVNVITAFDDSKDAVSFLDSDFKYRYVNKSYESYFGLRKDDIIGKSPADLMGRDQFSETIKPNLEKCLKGSVVSYQAWIDLPGSESRFMSVQYTPQYDYYGNTIGVLHLSRDITLQKQKEIKIIEENQALKAIIKALPGSISVIDTEYNMIETNKIKHTVSDLNEQDIIGQKCYEVFQQRDTPCPWCRVDEVLKTGESVVETTNPNDPRENVTNKAWKVFLDPIKNEHEEVVGIIEYGMDVTELRKAKEAAVAASKSKSNFLANMSHEIRTPINGIMGMIQLLQQTELDDEQYELSEYAINSTKRLTHLLSDILDLARVESGKLKIFSQKTNIYQLLDEIRQLFEPVARNKKLHFVVNLDRNIPEIVFTDPVRLHQILSNLLGNAIKFSDSGTVSIDANLIKHIGNKSRILFSVHDEGIGIADDKLDSLFNPYEQANTDYHKTQKGAGLGLAITKQIVDLMHGSISVESHNSGTTFNVSLPFETAERANDALLEDEQSVACKQRLKCLVAEDEKVSQLIIKKALEKRGHSVHCVEDGRKAIEALSSAGYDILFMDIQMPEMDGIEATQKIRAGEAGNENKAITIIAMTAYAMHGDKKKFIECGADDYISKPVNFGKLISILEKKP